MWILSPKTFVSLSMAALLVVAGASAGDPPVSVKNHPVFSLAKRLSRKGSLTRGDVARIEAEVRKGVDSDGRITPALQAALSRIEEKMRPLFDAGAARAYQTMVAKIGGKMMARHIGIPEENTPYWLKDPGPLDKFRSSAHVPKTADYVVIGGGLTGSSAARNLVSEVKDGKVVVVLEAADRPAAGASGRNGGNIEMIKENFLDEYRGFVEVQKDILKSRFPDLPEKILAEQAERQSTYLLRFFQANVREIQKAVAEDGIQADVSMTGWLRIAESAEEEKGLRSEIEFAKKLGIEFEVWSPEQIKAGTGIESKFSGRFIRESGNYHPYKYVNGVMKKAIDEGVKFYTGTPVERVERMSDGSYLVHTGDGPIRTKKIIVATNGYSRDLFPDLTFVEPRVSHISDFSHVPDQFQGKTVTKEKGDWYANYPKQDRYVDKTGQPRGTLHVGGGLDTPFPAEDVKNPPFIEEIYQEVRTKTGAIIPATKDQPPARAWSGVMAFTEDRGPIISFLYRDGVVDKNVVFIITCNGYGGSQCAIGGKVGADMSRTGEISEATPDDIFSMRRFQTDQPLFEFPGSKEWCLKRLKKASPP